TTSTTATSTASTTTTTAVTTTTGTTPTTTAAPPPTPEPPAAGGPGGVSGKTSPGLLGEAQGAEAETAAAPTIWLPGFVVDPTPPARRLAPAFARSLRSISARQHVPWWDVLGYLRAQGRTGRIPATSRRLRAVSTRLAAAHTSAHPWRGFFAVSDRRALA